MSTPPFGSDPSGDPPTFTPYAPPDQDLGVLFTCDVCGATVADDEPAMELHREWHRGA